MKINIMKPKTLIIAGFPGICKSYAVDDIKISEMTLNDMGDECGNMSSF